MKKLFELGNRYAANSSWVDFSLTKVCLFSLGLLAGSFLPKKTYASVRLAAGSLFGVSYAVLMKKVFGLITEMRSES